MIESQSCFGSTPLSRLGFPANRNLLSGEKTGSTSIQGRRSMMTRTGHLSARGLTKSYWKGRNEVPVLRGVELEVEQGEMLAVVGASGSGKSTLLHILGLLDAPNSGEVFLAGDRIDDRPAGDR